MGYEVLEVFEVCCYPQIKDRPFKKYINKFLQLKSQTSGWLSAVKTKEQEEQFLTEYYRIKGFKSKQHKNEF